MELRATDRLDFKKYSYLFRGNSRVSKNVIEVDKTVTSSDGQKIPLKFDGVRISIAKDGRMYKKDLVGDEVKYTDLASMLDEPPYEAPNRVRVLC